MALVGVFFVAWVPLKNLTSKWLNGLKLFTWSCVCEHGAVGVGCRVYHSDAVDRPDLCGAVSEVPQEEPHNPVSFGRHCLSMVSP